MNNDFCFIVVAYNQERYVYQHLEGIKYQIEHYGKDKKLQIIFADDGSKDRTVARAKYWLEKNKILFNKIDIINHVVNGGTIRNMLDAEAMVDAPAYKFLACDDLYYCNNIFEVVDKADVVIVPSIEFYDDKTFRKELTLDFLQFLKYKNHIGLKNKICRMLKYSQCLPSPSVFLNSKFWKEEELRRILLKYKYIEDVPEWDYVFNIYSKPFDIYVNSKPYVLYRQNVGVSTSKTWTEDSPVHREHIKMRKDIPCQASFLPKYYNPYCYWHYFINTINKYLAKFDEQLCLDMEVWNNEIVKFDDYYNKILDSANKLEREF